MLLCCPILFYYLCEYLSTSSSSSCYFIISMCGLPHLHSTCGRDMLWSQPLLLCTYRYSLLWGACCVAWLLVNRFVGSLSWKYFKHFIKQTSSAPTLDPLFNRFHSTLLPTIQNHPIQPLLHLLHHLHAYVHDLLVYFLLLPLLVNSFPSLDRQW
jgi:hypothetical protein